MAQGDQTQSGLAIAPALIIVIVIICAIVCVVVLAAMYRICQRKRTETGQGDEPIQWNPNKRSAEQDAYMLAVRWTNNMHAWERAKYARAEFGDSLLGRCHRGWFKRQPKAARAGVTEDNLMKGEQYSSSGSPDRFNNGISSDEYLGTEPLVGNPYRDLLQEAFPSLQYQEETALTEKHNRPTHLRESDIEPFLYQQYQTSINDRAVFAPSTTAAKGPSSMQVTDDTEDMADSKPSTSPYQSLYPTEMPRSSSMYSGDIFSVIKLQSLGLETVGGARKLSRLNPSRFHTIVK